MCFHTCIHRVAQVLPAVYLFVGRSLNATPSQLGAVTLCRALVQTMASPLSGILGDRYDRVSVLASGAFIWAVMTSAMAMSTTQQQVGATSAELRITAARMHACALTRQLGFCMRAGDGVCSHQRTGPGAAGALLPEPGG